MAGIIGIKRAFFLAIFSVMSVAFLATQELPRQHHEVLVRLKLLDVVVTDGSGNFIPDLSKEDFLVFEDGQLRPIESAELVTLKSREKFWLNIPGRLLRKS